MAETRAVEPEEVRVTRAARMIHDIGVAKTLGLSDKSIGKLYGVGEARICKLRAEHGISSDACPRTPRRSERDWPRIHKPGNPEYRAAMAALDKYFDNRPPVVR